MLQHLNMRSHFKYGEKVNYHCSVEACTCRTTGMAAKIASLSPNNFILESDFLNNSNPLYYKDLTSIEEKKKKFKKISSIISKAFSLFFHFVYWMAFKNHGNANVYAHNLAKLVIQFPPNFHEAFSKIFLVSLIFEFRVGRIHLCNCNLLLFLSYFKK
jgi:hypothetical protein